MSMVKRDVRLKQDSFDKICEISKKENKTIQDVIRELCDIGIQKKNESIAPKMSFVEKELISNTKKTLYVLSLMFNNQYNLESSEYGSLKEAAKTVEDNLKKSMYEFEKNIIQS